ncbi:MAG: hypothetical protein IT200_07290 [Thermoleophilia bacterium]|nr:hypothetical protein [Thermoleophilia bacterium]
MHALLDEPRLAAFAASPEPVVFARIARDWAASIPAHATAIRGADAAALPEALHELRSGAVAVGLPLLAATLAGIEQRAEAGNAPAAGEIDAALELADRAAAALAAWWDRTGIPV